MYRLTSIAYLLMILALSSCHKEPKSSVVIEETSITTVPIGFPEIPFPDDNPFSQKKWELGKMLFYEKALSVDHSISCGSCHKTALAFSDNVAKSIGANQQTGRQNSPSLANVAYHPYYTRAGGVPTLEMQILVPIQEHDEFDFNIIDIAERLNQIPEYVQLSNKVFGRNPDPYVITRAISTFERTLVSGHSRYDQMLTTGDSSFLSLSERRGMSLFFSNRTSCSKCHSGFNFTNYAFENNGLYENYSDIGRARLTGNEADNALFKVPSLRNIALTAPYMHDGSIPDLLSVINHYDKGGHDHINKNSLIRPLGLTPNEKADLINFLHSLTDRNFITNKNFSDEEL